MHLQYVLAPSSRHGRRKLCAKTFFFVFPPHHFLETMYVVDTTNAPL